MANESILPSDEVAYNTLFGGVCQRVFFNKMAALGHAPQTEKQAQSMLALAGNIAQLDEDDVVKQAAEADDPYAAANAALEQQMHGIGYGQRTAGWNDRQLSYKQAAANFMASDEVYNAVLVQAAAEAAQYTRQIQG